jgi:hypothetical protein
MRWCLLVLVGCAGEGGETEDDGLRCRAEVVAAPEFDDRAGCDCESCAPEGEPLDGNHVTLVRCADGWEMLVDPTFDDSYGRARDHAGWHCTGEDY